MIRFTFSFFLLFFLSWQAFAQGSDKSVIPSSPQSAEFEKYVNYNVSMYNGVPDISIPLYTIHLKGMDIPISLSYHASGIKYRQTNGDVGVGWTLNPGYRITRTIYGLPDEKHEMPSDIGARLASLPEGVDGDHYLAMFTRDLNGMPRREDDSKWYDGEYDIFSYMLPTESGRFLIKDRQNKVVQTLEESYAKIAYQNGLSAIGPADGILNFDVADDQGNKYYFGEHSTNDANVFEFSNGSGQATGWALKNLTTALGDQLAFNYIPKSISGWNFLIRTETIISASNCYETNYEDPIDEPVADNGYFTFYLNDIHNDREKVVFERDVNGFVSKLKVYMADDQLLKSIEFFYSKKSDGFHVFLDSIQIKDKNSAAVQTYRFDYNESRESVDGVDQWGYYSGNSAPLALHNEFRDDPILKSPRGDGYGTVEEKVGGGFIDRKSGNADYFSLKSITYPTGGKTDYNYESNVYKDYSGRYYYGGGLRIQSIISNDLVSGETLKREFKYGDDVVGSGIAKVQVDESFFADETVMVEYINQYPFVDNIIARKVMSYSSQMLSDAAVTGFTSSLVNYPKVTEWFSDGGHIEYKYDIGREYEIGYYNREMGYDYCGVQFTYPGLCAVQGYLYANKPLLREKKYYSGTGSLAKSEAYDYYDPNGVILEGLKVKPFGRAPGGIDEHDYSVFNVIGHFFRYLPYQIYYGRALLQNKRETYFQDNRSTVLSTNYEYNDQKLPVKITTNSSNGKIHYTYLTYASDYAVGSGFVDVMKANNLVTTPVETVEAEQDAAGQITILSGMVNKFRLSNPSQQESVLAIENRYPLLLQNFKFSNRAGGVLPTSGTASVFQPDNVYKSKITYEQYDAASNLLQKTKTNDLTTSYVWDYANTYPIAEISNAAVNDVAYTSFESDGAGNWTISGSTINNDAITGTKSFNGTLSKSLAVAGDYVVTAWSKTTATVNGLGGSVISTKGSWQLLQWDLTNINNVVVQGSQLDEVRLYPKGATMETYTYEPLVGMTGQCDANNVISYFEYDAFSRLSLVRDQDKNIVKRFCYNYYGEVEQCATGAEPNWTSTSNVRVKPCPINPAYTMVMQQQEEKDVNPNSPSYNTTRWMDKYLTPTSLSVSSWENTTEIRCKTINGLNTGEQEVKQVDANPCSDTYSTFKWVTFATNTNACPLPVGNDLKTKPFVRTNCGPNGTGGSYTYVVPANKYLAATPLQANALAQQEIDTQGQDSANVYGTCNSLYTCDDLSGYYNRNSCTLEQEPVPYYVSIPLGMFTSTIDKLDANNKALQYAHTQANQNGTCQQLPTATMQYSNFDLISSYWVTFTNTVTGAQYNFEIMYGGGTLGTIPVGWYDVHIYTETGATDPYNFTMSCGFTMAGAEGNFYGMYIDGSCPTISISNL
jgi:hypothetical protein